MNELAFTEDGYRRLLRSGIEAGYRFLAFDDPERDAGRLVCLLRHDVDADPGAAYRMARIESELGVSATYFFMLRSPVYNVFGRANQQFARGIIALGHRVGLHYDQGFQPGEHMDTAAWIRFEADVLSRNLNTPIAVVSFHQPGPEVLEGRVDTGRLINTYSSEHLRGFHYLSDSNRQWRDADPLRVFRDRTVEKLHLLIHPMWWMHGQHSTTEGVWNAVMLSNFDRSQRQLLETERAFGKKRRLVIERSVDDDR